MTEQQPPIIGTGKAAGLTQTELQALFQLVVKRPVPAMNEIIATTEGVLILAAGTLKSHGFDQPSVLMVMARLWGWLEADDETHGMTFHVVDRRYVGWHSSAGEAMVDMNTGEDISRDKALSCVAEYIAYNLYELLERLTAITRGERVSLWERKDAAAQAPHGETSATSSDLDGSQVFRDNAGDLVP